MIKQVLSDIFGVPVSEITDGSSMQTIAAWDSLKHMEMIAAIEENLGIRLKADHIAEMTSVQAIRDILKGYGH